MICVGKWSVFISVGLLLLGVGPGTVFAQASESFPIQLQFGEDIEPPTVPQNVTVVPIASSQIDVSWDAATDNFGVAGYQVFRDQNQVATTSQTQFSDTGLQASTTYAYEIRSFDVAGNTATATSPVATTTFAPPPPPPEPEEDPEPEQGGSVQIPRPAVRTFAVDSGSEVARVRFTTNVPTRYTFHYGTSEAFADGAAQSAVWRREHTTVLTDLTPDTRYQYELYIDDRFGREVLAEAGTFTTNPRYTMDLPSNVRSFVANAVGNDVLLGWVPPEDDAFAYVRIVRNSRFFPGDPLDGTVVYEGADTSYTDVGAMSGVDEQYYTIFAYNLAGVPASGVIAVAARVPRVPTPIDPIDPDPEPDPEAPTTTAPTASIATTDIEIVTADAIQTLADADLAITTDASFTVRVPSDLIPSRTRSVLMTLWRPDEVEQPLSFFLQADSAGRYHSATMPGLAVPGLYDVRFALYDGVPEQFFSIDGVVRVAEVPLPAGSDQVEDTFLLGLGYLIAGGVVGLMAAIGLYGLLLWLYRQWYTRRIGS